MTTTKSRRSVLHRIAAIMPLIAALLIAGNGMAQNPQKEDLKPNGAAAAQESPAAGGNPLYIVDGQEVADPSAIDPDTIESTNVITPEKAEPTYGEKGRNSVVEIITKKADTTIEPDNICIFCSGEDMPTFEGGDFETFRKWVALQVRYPQDAAPDGGKVMASFVVEKDGTLSDIEIVRSGGEAFDKEVLRVLRTSPKWEPGKYEGNNVRVKYTLPVWFAAM